MIKNNTIRTAAAGAVGGGVVIGGLFGAGLASISPAMSEAMVMVASTVYAGAVIGGILGALLAIVRNESRLTDPAEAKPEVAYERAA